MIKPVKLHVVLCNKAYKVSCRTALIDAGKKAVSYKKMTY